MTTKYIDIVEEEEYLVPFDDLDHDAAERLFRAHKGQVSIATPFGGGSHYRLRSLGFVGQFRLTDSLVLRIMPKISIPNLFGMWDYVGGSRALRLLPRDWLGVSSFDALFETLASILLKGITNRIRVGLYKEYVPRTAALPYVTGRIIIPDALYRLYRGHPRLDSSYCDHSYDIMDNRILAWSVHVLLRLGLGSEVLSQGLRRVSRQLDGAVRCTPVKSADCVGRAYNRLNADYESLHVLSKFFIDHCGPSMDSGTHRFVPFLIDMPSLFESFVAKWLSEHLPEDVTLTPQHTVTPSESVRFRMDLVIRDKASGAVLAVADTKYKSTDTPSSDDISQVTAYAALMKTSRAFLIYPSPTRYNAPIQMGNITVQCVSFDFSSCLSESGKSALDQIFARLGAVPYKVSI